MLMCINEFHKPIMEGDYTWICARNYAGKEELRILKSIYTVKEREKGTE